MAPQLPLHADPAAPSPALLPGAPGAGCQLGALLIACLGGQWLGRVCLGCCFTVPSWRVVRDRAPEDRAAHPLTLPAAPG